MGLCHRAGYEAQAAVELEAAVSSAWRADSSAYAFGITAGGFDPAPVLRGWSPICGEGTEVPVLAARFHRGVARAVAELSRRARRATGLSTVTLSGGVFANALLEDECTALLTDMGFAVLRHGEVPERRRSGPGPAGGRGARTTGGVTMSGSARQGRGHRRQHRSAHRAGRLRRCAETGVSGVRARRASG
ncbi:hypothetical protein ACFQV4_30450 [Streptomyces thermocarboxydus]